MIVYPAAIPGIYPSDVAYYPLGQYNLTTNTRGIYPTRGGALGRGGRGRGIVGRNSYLGYSAGKATYGRYYAKNNPEQRLVDINGNSVELVSTSQMLPQVGANQNALTLYKPGTVQGIVGQHQQNAAAAAAAYASACGGQIQQAVPGLTTQHALVSPTAGTSMTPVSPTVAILEEICQSQLWGSPNYQLMSTQGADNRQLYLFKVSIPALASLYPHQPYYQVN